MSLESVLLEVCSYQPPSIQILSEAETIKWAININESAQHIHLTRYAVFKYPHASKVEEESMKHTFLHVAEQDFSEPSR